VLSQPQQLLPCAACQLVVQALHSVFLGPSCPGNRNMAGVFRQRDHAQACLLSVLHSPVSSKPKQKRKSLRRPCCVVYSRHNRSCM
jgi:hypothetical protein